MSAIATLLVGLLLLGTACQNLAADTEPTQSPSAAATQKYRAVEGFCAKVDFSPLEELFGSVLPPPQETVINDRRGAHCMVRFTERSSLSALRYSARLSVKPYDHGAASCPSFPSEPLVTELAVPEELAALAPCVHWTKRSGGLMHVVAIYDGGSHVQVSVMARDGTPGPGDDEIVPRLAEIVGSLLAVTRVESF